MLSCRSWTEFRETGLLLFVNTFLHIFGWAIVYNFDDKTGELLEVYPARTKFRGFGGEQQDKAYMKVTEYMRENIKDLYSDVMEVPSTTVEGDNKTGIITDEQLAENW